ncbi:hypothetical protein M011DRAFT_298640 [Sporormia fimetaria CBS 119925]|uniref:Zinc knuckle-domain-containing protein n=1 Tax=Sporormia fimetaria CBS 119925 TaxID=1340428 RepID=A0A6A6UUK9_9PLEO|nr:hypothetical protein M011DRAFT_298640 [Sporormia fimetaria CBS 119925]
MNARGPFRGRSKANPTTQCQKCLQRGHYSYECTVSAQERPYKPRPSRTQQLLNPKLQPKLTTEVPEDLLQTKGTADAILAKKKEERGRDRSRSSRGGARARSYSTSSSDSISTISTHRSPSRSPTPRHRRPDRDASGGRSSRRIRHRSPSVRSDPSRAAHRRRSPGRRSRSRSPGCPYAGTSRGHARDGRYGDDATKKRGRSPSADSYSSREDSGRVVRRRMTSSSPARRGRTSGSTRMDTTNDPDRYRERRTESRSSSMRRARPRSPSISPAPYNRAAPRNRFDSGTPPRGPPLHTSAAYPERRPPPAPAAPPRERSLSPYSKRVAMTRAMQGR